MIYSIILFTSWALNTCPQTNILPSCQWLCLQHRSEHACNFAPRVSSLLGSRQRIYNAGRLFLTGPVSVKFSIQAYIQALIFGDRQLVLLFPEADDLACELLSILTKAPLRLQGVEDFSAFICPIADELSYSHHPPVTHRRLWRLLTRVVRHTLSARGLTSAELMAIRGLVTRRMQ